MLLNCSVDIASIRLWDMTVLQQAKMLEPLCVPGCNDAFII